MQSPEYSPHSLFLRLDSSHYWPRCHKDRGTSKEIECQLDRSVHQRMAHQLQLWKQAVCKQCLHCKVDIKLGRRPHRLFYKYQEGMEEQWQSRKDSNGLVDR